MGPQVRADEDWVEDVVDRADDEASPDGEQGSLAPVAGKTEVDRDGSPDEEGAEGGNHGTDGEREGPEDDARNSEDPEGEASKDTLHCGDGEPAERGGEDSVADTLEELAGFIVAERKE